MQAADTDHSGTINYTGKLLVIYILEFIAATIDAQIFMREDSLRTAFQMFDVDNSGKIDATEVRALLEGEDFKDQISKDQLNKIIKEVDANGDGEIDFEEFLSMMRQIAS